MIQITGEGLKRRRECDRTIPQLRKVRKTPSGESEPMGSVAAASHLRKF